MLGLFIASILPGMVISGAASSRGNGSWMVDLSTLSQPSVKVVREKRKLTLGRESVQ